MSQNKNNRTTLIRRLAGMELLENRCLLSVNPLDFGVVYYEGARTESGSGVDSAADYIYVSFNGGAAGTQLDSLTIDMAAYGMDGRYSFIDQGQGAYDSVPFTIYSADGFTVKDYTITRQGTQLTITFDNFNAGDVLIISMDVDEVLGVTDGSKILDAEVTGAEFSLSSKITAVFTTDHYEDLTVTKNFRDQYQSEYDQYNLTQLPNDAFTNGASIPAGGGEDQSVYTAGAFVQGVQVPLPATISGKVYEDVDYNHAYDSSVDRLLGNVQVVLWKLNESTGQYQQVATTHTNAQGEYSFNVDPGTYRVTEVTPDGYLDVSSFIGTIDGVPTGTIIDANGLTNISILGGQDSIHNDFSEYVPGELSGHVFEDVNDDGVMQENEPRLPGVTITITNLGTGETFTTVTDKDGYWEFKNLTPGRYCVTEATPAGYLDGKDHIGTLDGSQITDSAAEDKICNIYVYSGDSGEDYDFGEIRPASVSGTVWVDANKNDKYDDGEKLLENVKIELRDASGKIIATKYTNSSGYYIFENLAPGVYQVFEYQPDGYLNGGQAVGSKGGSNGATDLIVGITLVSGDAGVKYDFWEYQQPYAQISGYVFQDGDTLQLKYGEKLPDNLWEQYPGVRGNNSTPIAGVTLVLADKDGNPILDANGKMITTTTDKNGYYQFTGLTAGTYCILEMQPDGYRDGIDTPGSLGGSALAPNGDKISNISVDNGDNGTEYNFSEIIVKWDTKPGDDDDDDNGTPTIKHPPGRPGFSSGSSPLGPGVGYIPHFYGRSSLALGGGGLAGSPAYAWHLSVVNAGTPRVYGDNSVAGTPWAKAVFDPNTWRGEAMQRVQAILASDNATPMMVLVGLDGAIPLTGDFNGDGKDELAVYYEGFWFIDLNGNLEWDANDLWAQLGSVGDQPVVGDWDGDGKADIGIFGPQWQGDKEMLAHEPGLPDSQNRLHREYKNIPPEAKMAHFFRDMKKTSTGEVRRDVIDHVFAYGKEGDVAVTGDWNGDGITQIGVFRNGEWILDTDGDGQFTANDTRFRFGQKGDTPVVGNWDSDGISRVGVYRDGQWKMLHGDGEVEIAYRGAPGEKPLVADFTGNGSPDLVTYKEVTPESLDQIRTARHDDGSRAR